MNKFIEKKFIDEYMNENCLLDINFFKKYKYQLHFLLRKIFINKREIIFKNKKEKNENERVLDHLQKFYKRERLIKQQN